MGRNAFFNVANSQLEQTFFNGLQVESIETYGLQFMYLPRRTYSLDILLTEDPQHYFDTAYDTCLYVKNAQGFEGKGHFLTQVTGGLELRDSLTLVIATQAFMDDVGFEEDFTRPREGDLIYFQEHNKLFEITFVQKYRLFYPLGALFTYDLNCELFEYSAQKFSTGIRAIDSIQTNLTEDFFDWAILCEDGRTMVTEDGAVVLREIYQPESILPLDQTDYIRTTADADLDFTERSPFEGESW